MNNKGLVLLIDDDAPTARFMRLILEPEGYELSVVPDRKQALAAMSERRPSVVIMDYMMGGLSPEDFIDESRGKGFNGPILLCTAMHRDFDLPVDDILLKPFQPDELPRRLSSLLSPKH